MDVIEILVNYKKSMGKPIGYKKSLGFLQHCYALWTIDYTIDWIKKHTYAGPIEAMEELVSMFEDLSCYSDENKDAGWIFSVARDTVLNFMDYYMDIDALYLKSKRRVYYDEH